MYAATDYGTLLSAAQAAPILAEFNIAADTWIDPIAGEPVEYGGKKYIIFQGEYPIFGGSRPDGYHFVYALSKEEIEEEKEQEEARKGPDFQAYIDLAMKLGIAGVVAYIAINAIKIFKN